MATCGTNLVAQTQNNRVHLFRLQMLIIDGGIIVLRCILDQKLIGLGITLRACLNQEKTTLGKMKIRGIITQSQYDSLFPQSGTGPSTSDMDITLIIMLLRIVRFFGLNKSFDWSIQPRPNDISIEADIYRLKHYRNTISHLSTTTGIQHSVFTNWWNDIERLLIRLCPPILNIQQIISDLKTCSLDPEEISRIEKEINLWLDHENNVNQLREDIETVKDNIGELINQFGDMKEALHDMKKRQGSAVPSSTNTVDLQHVQSESVTEETIYTRSGQVTHTEEHAEDLVTKQMKNLTTVSNNMQNVQTVNYGPLFRECKFEGNVTFHHHHHHHDHPK